MLCCPEPVTPAVEQVSRPAPHACAAGPPGLAPQHPAAACSLACWERAGAVCRLLRCPHRCFHLCFQARTHCKCAVAQTRPCIQLAGLPGGWGCWPSGPARCSGQCLCLWVACAASVCPGCCSGPGRPGCLTPTPPSPAPGMWVPPPLGVFSESSGGGGRPGPEGPP